MTTITEPILLTNEFARAHLARAIPGAYFDRERKAWLLAYPTPRSAAVALRMFPELAADYPELPALRDELNQDVRPFDNATPFDSPVVAADVRAALAQEFYDFFRFQELDMGYVAAVLESHGGGYIGWERGLGKTLGACALMDELGCQKVLVVCPNTAKDSVWKAEIERWCPWYSVHVLPNDKDRRERMLHSFREEAFTNDARGAVLVVHYEALAIIAGKGKKKPGSKSVPLGQGWEKLGEWDLIVADEVHRIKQPKSQMARALKKVPARMKVGLSGSIIQNHAEELFSPLQWLFPDRYSSKWRDWNDRYLDYIEGPFGKVCIGVKTERLEEMREELGVFMVYRRKEDELDLPPKMEQTLLVDLSPQQRRVYNELLTTCQAELDNGETLKAADGLVMLTRLRQIASGLDTLAESVADSTKLDLATDLILDNEDEAFVVFTWWRASAKALEDRLEKAGVRCWKVDGSIDQSERAERIALFQEGHGRVFIGTLATLSESVTLHRATQAIFIDRSWNPAANVQAEDRIYRIGQEKPVTITHLVARDTVDELRVTPTIANKEALRRLIFGGV